MLQVQYFLMKLMQLVVHVGRQMNTKQVDGYDLLNVERKEKGKGNI